MQLSQETQAAQNITAMEVLSAVQEKDLQKRAREDSNLQPSDSKSEALKSQHTSNKAFTENPKNVLASCLAQIVQKHPKLAELIESWFMEHCGSLTEQEQSAIRKLLGQGG